LFKIGRQATGRKEGRNMILAIKTDDGSVMIDKFNRLERSTANPCGLPTPFLDYRPRQNNMITPAGNGVEISLFRDDVFLTTVISYQPVYVMNDRGETIERL